MSLEHHGSMPRRNRCIILPMWKLWPFAVESPSSHQTLLHLLMNHVCFIGDHNLFAVSNAKSSASGGMSIFKLQWCSKAPMALHLHVESEMLMVSPSSFVMVWGTSKLMNFWPLAVISHLMFVDCETCGTASQLAAHLVCSSTKRPHRPLQRLRHQRCSCGWGGSEGPWGGRL